MTDNTQLAACPFCGGEAAHGYIRYCTPLHDTWWDDGSPITEAFYVNCVKCGIGNGRSGLVGGYPTKDEAALRWNQRTKPAVPDVREAEEWLGGDWFEKWQDATENADDGLMATLDALRGRVERTILAALTQSPTCCEAERERCAKIAEAEPELPGDPPPEFQQIAEQLRATVRVTKRNIATAIRGADQSPRACCEAERERCAKIAESEAGVYSDDGEGDAWIALRIATAIRGADQ